MSETVQHTVIASSHAGMDASGNEFEMATLSKTISASGREGAGKKIPGKLVVADSAAPISSATNLDTPYDTTGEESLPPRELVAIQSSAKAAWVISLHRSTHIFELNVISDNFSRLAAGCCLILAGAIADFIGNRNINLLGCLLLAIFTTAAGVAADPIQFIVFRAFQGVAISLCLPTAVSILSNNFVPGRQRNIGFGCIGLSQPVGFAVGMVLGGVLVDTPLTWRASFYLTAGLMGLLFCVSVWLLPADVPRDPFSWKRFGTDIDWAGAGLSSASLGIFSYVFAIITGDFSNIKQPENIVLICVAGLSAIGFVYWMGYREKSGRNPLIPNSLWKNSAFTTICVMVLLSYAVLNGMEYWLSLFFQKVQGVSALGAAIRFIPEIIVGIILNFGTGMFVDRVPAHHLITISSALAAVAALVMSLIDPAWGYWRAAFWAVLLCPCNADVIFTVANLIITDAFSSDTQALAGAVFNTVAQFGYSIGVMVMAIMGNSVTEKSKFDSESPEGLMEGYNSVFWMCFALQMLACAVSYFGLKKVGKVGLKRE